jgi:hypothetical protein
LRIGRVVTMSYPSRRLIRKRTKLMRFTGVTGELLITAGLIPGYALACLKGFNHMDFSQIL